MLHWKNRKGALKARSHPQKLPPMKRGRGIAPRKQVLALSCRSSWSSYPRGLASSWAVSRTWLCQPLVLSGFGNKKVAALRGVLDSYFTVSEICWGHTVCGGIWGPESPLCEAVKVNPGCCGDHMILEMPALWNICQKSCVQGVESFQEREMYFVGGTTGVLESARPLNWSLRCHTWNFRIRCQPRGSWSCCGPVFSYCAPSHIHLGMYTLWYYVLEVFFGYYRVTVNKLF